MQIISSRPGSGSTRLIVRSSVISLLQCQPSQNKPKQQIHFQATTNPNNKSTSKPQQTQTTNPLPSHNKPKQQIHFQATTNPNNKSTSKPQQRRQKLVDSNWVEDENGKRRREIFIEHYQWLNIVSNKIIADLDYRGEQSSPILATWKLKKMLV